IALRLKAIEIDDAVRYQTDLVLERDLAGQLDEALADAERQGKDHPESGPVYVTLGMAQAVKKNQDFANVSLQNGVGLSSVDDIRTVHDQIDAALAAAPNNPMLKSGSKSLWSATNSKKKIEEALKSIQPRKDGKIDFDAAFQHFNEAVQEYDRDAEIFY